MKYVITWSEKVTQYWESTVDANSIEEAKQLVDDDVDIVRSNARTTDEVCEESFMNVSVKKAE